MAVLGAVIVGFAVFISLDTYPLGKYISKANSDGLATSVSVYVEDLSTGESFGFNENEKYQPQSMFKVIDLIYTLKGSDSASLVSTKTYNPFFGQGVHYEPRKLDYGPYSVSKLLEQLITQSDDAALHALFNKTKSEETYRELGLPVFKDGEAYAVSPKDASKMFVGLYKGEVLPTEQTKQALDLLSRTEFTRGIVGGVPSGIQVAHKFGENTILKDTGGVVGHGLNDCGIVFAKVPYVICVMTLGKEFKGLETVIQNISRVVYLEMEK